MKINVKKLREAAKLPYRATEGSAGADLYACLEAPVTVQPDQRATIPVGIAVEIPAGFGGFVFPRSSVACKFGVSLPNCVGVIDSDYRGELCVPVINHSAEPYTINGGDRIAQLVILPVENAVYEYADDLTDTQRGEGGFGSTGKS